MQKNGRLDSGSDDKDDEGYLRGPHSLIHGRPGRRVTGYCIMHLCWAKRHCRRAWRGPPPPSPPAFPLTLQLYDCSNALQMKRGANPPQIIDKSSPRGAGIKKKILRQTDSLCALGHPFKELWC